MSEWASPFRWTADALQQLARPLVKTVAAAVSLGTGASLGPEGPSVEIGNAFADGFGSLLRSRHKHMLSLMAAGSGAGAHVLRADERHRHLQVCMGQRGIVRLKAFSQP